MCGIAAMFAHGADAPEIDADELIAIRDRMTQRGPDGAGMWISEDRRIGLAHRRLSIIDLSDAGAQPMWNAERTLCIIYNGELYNFRALRSALEANGISFQSNSDTEVLLHLYADSGAAMLDRLRGMYAFAIWDARKRELFAARDPFGIKPLYYSDDGRTLRVASQVKALLAGGKLATTADPAGHVGFFLWGSIPEPFTFHKEISALPAGHTLTVSANGTVAVRSFCSIPQILSDAEAATNAGIWSSDAQQQLLHDALRDTAEHHLVADVPVGVFLSAGLDSTTLAALVSETHPDVRTVTLGFDEYRGSANDETVLAEQVAQHYRTDHQTVSITRQLFEQESARVLDAMDQPTIDGINTYFVSLAAKRAGLKVALSGLGGDEVFAGYPSFTDVPRIVNSTRRLGLLRPFGKALRVISSRAIKRYTSPKYAGIFEYGGSYSGAYLLRRALFMPWELPGLLHPDLVREGWARLDTMGALARISDPLESPRLKVSALELCSYMRHQLLRDSDWAGMAHSLEIRVPLVDVTLLHKIAPLLASPNPPTKLNMARSPSRSLPESVLSRPKTGFTVPVREWMQQSLGPTAGAERGLRGWARQVYARFADPATMHRLSMRSRRRQKPNNGDQKSDARAPASDLRSPTSDLRVLMLLSDGFGGTGGIAKFNRDFLAAVCADENVASVAAVPRLMPNAPGPLPPKLRWVVEGIGGKARFVRTALREAARLRRGSSRGSVPITICGHINLLPIAVAARRLTGGTLHLIVHGIDAWQPTRDPLVNASVRAIDGFIAVSEVTKRRFLNWSGLRFDQGLVLPNCVDVSAFGPGPKPPDLLARYGVDGRKTIMTLGRLSPQERYKGFDEVIGILPSLAPEFPGITYLVCGDGADRPRLVQLAKDIGCVVSESPGSNGTVNGASTAESGASPRVIFTGHIAEGEKAEHFRLADAYVMPSWGEGFGIVYLEALACGIPVIGSAVDGSREALREGRLGAMVDPKRPDEIHDVTRRVLNGDPAVTIRPAPDEIGYFDTARYRKRVSEFLRAVAPIP